MEGIHLKSKVSKHVNLQIYFANYPGSLAIYLCNLSVCHFFIFFSHSLTEILKMREFS